MSIKLTPLTTFKYLITIIGILLFGNILAIAIKLNYDHALLNGIGRLFDFDKEANIPSFYATLTLLLSAMLLLFIYWKDQNTNRSQITWLVVALLFMGLALDEISSLHEKLIPILRASFDLSGYLYYGWVIPYGIGTALLGLILIPFLRSLPRQTGFLFVLSAFIFVSGAVGMELLGGRHHELYGTHNFWYSLYYTIEELLEMLGIAIFLYALLDYIKDFITVRQIYIYLQSTPEDKEDLKNSN